MRKNLLSRVFMLVMLAMTASCEVVDNDMEKHVDERQDTSFIALQDVASILSAVLSVLACGVLLHLAG